MYTNYYQHLTHSKCERNSKYNQIVVYFEKIFWNIISGKLGKIAHCATQQPLLTSVRRVFNDDMWIEQFGWHQIQSGVVLHVRSFVLRWKVGKMHPLLPPFPTEKWDTAIFLHHFSAAIADAHWCKSKIWFRSLIWKIIDFKLNIALNLIYFYEKL